MSSHYSFNVTLYRDSLSTPWGFRLEGGVDFQSPLTIQRVFQGSPAAGDLQRGDIILSIQSRDATTMYHQEANEIISRAGGSIHFSIKRGHPYPGSDGAAYHAGRSHTIQLGRPLSQYYSQPIHYNNPHASYQNPNEFHENYLRNRVIEKVHDPKPILSQTGSPIMPGFLPSTNSRSTIKTYRPTKTVPILSSVNTLPRTNFKTVTNVTPVPFHEKQMVDKLHDSLHKIRVNQYKQKQFNPSSNFYHQQPITIQQPSNYYTPAQNQQQTYDDLYELTIQDKIRNFQKQNQNQNYPQQQRHYSNDDANYSVSPWQNSGPKVIYSQHQASEVSTHVPHQRAHAPQKSQAQQGPKIVNNQYNTPIGLYSKNSMNEEMYKQLGVTNQPVNYAPAHVPSSDF